MSNMMSGVPILSSDPVLEMVLSDIPLFCVGLTAIAVFTFFLFMRRVTLLAVYLYTSSIFAFAAGILDLSHILVEGCPQAVAEIGLAPVSGFSIARETFLSLSLGFLYLFLWCLVAQCPHGESSLRPEGLKTKYDPRVHTHSASWQRWGALGMMLQWTSLSASISIPLLQLVWRIVSGQHRYGSLYVAESTIETVISAIFILKLLLNVFISPLSPRQSLKSYIAPIIALLISAGLGVGNILCFALSETTLGRFLRSVEMYILIIYNLVATFYKMPTTTSIQQAALQTPAPMSTRSAEKSGTADASLPFQSLPSQENNSSDIIVIDRSASAVPTIASRISSWIMPRRFSQRPAISEGPSWDQDRELGLASKPEVVGAEFSGTSISSTPITGRVGVPSLASDYPPPSAAPVGLNADYPEQGSPRGRSFTDVSLSYYTMDPTSQPSPPVPALSTVERRSVLSNHGDVEQSNTDMESTRKPPVVLQSNSISSFDELLRQQTELDKSIAALRLFSPIPPGPDPTSDTLTAARNQSTSLDAVASESQNRSLSTSTSYSGGGQKPESASGRSEFSLSNFPEPPMASDDISSSPSRVVPKIKRQRPHLTRKVSEIQGSFDNNGLLLPNSSVETARFNSAGTQYDVTSFIGGLTGPTPVTSFKTATPLSDVDSDEDMNPTIDTAVVVSAPPLRPMFLPSIAARTFPPEVGQERSAIPDKPEERQSSPLMRDSGVVVLRPFLLGTASPAVLSPPLSSTMVPIGSRRRGGSNAGWKPTISAPRPVLQEGEEPGAFERPRPPPLRFVRSVDKLGM